MMIGSANIHAILAVTFWVMIATDRATASAHAGQGTVLSHATRNHVIRLVWAIVTTTSALVVNVQAHNTNLAQVTVHVYHEVAVRLEGTLLVPAQR